MERVFSDGRVEDYHGRTGTLYIVMHSGWKTVVERQRMEPGCMVFSLRMHHYPMGADPISAIQILNKNRFQRLVGHLACYLGTLYG